MHSDILLLSSLLRKEPFSKAHWLFAHPSPMCTMALHQLHKHTLLMTAVWVGYVVCLFVSQAQRAKAALEQRTTTTKRACLGPGKG